MSNYNRAQNTKVQLKYLQNLLENFKYKFVHLYKATGFDRLGEYVSNNLLQSIFQGIHYGENSTLLYLLDVRAFTVSSSSNRRPQVSSKGWTTFVRTRHIRVLTAFFCL